MPMMILDMTIMILTIPMGIVAMTIMTMAMTMVRLV